MTGARARHAGPATTLPRGLYGIIGAPAQSDAGHRLRAMIDLARAYLEGGCRVLQLRMKGAGAGEMAAVGRALLTECRAHGAILIVNDRADVAAAIGADGVHLGQDDIPIAAARALVPRAIIGKSTHDLTQLAAAIAEGADYVGFGPIFMTQSKTSKQSPRGVDGLRAICRAASVPVVAIGGISAENIAAVAAAGAHGAAVISAVAGAVEPSAAAQSLAFAFKSTTPL